MIGLFLGSTDFPQIILKTLKKENKKYFIIDLSKNNQQGNHYIFWSFVLYY